MPDSNPANPWQSLEDQAASLANTHLAELFASDSGRFDKFHRRCGPLLLDFSKQRITEDTLAALCNLADACQLRDWQARLFGGDSVNDTEQRQALHWALRQPLNASSQAGEAVRSVAMSGDHASNSQMLKDEAPSAQTADRQARKNQVRSEQLAGDQAPNSQAPSGQPPDSQTAAINNAVHQQLDAMAAVVERLHTRQWLGAEGLPITDVVNLGVGGSHLGPLMATRALVDIAHPAAPTLHFVSTLDGTELATLLRELDPRTTLFIVSSKSFGTIDTLSNAATARDWLKHHLALIDNSHDDSLLQRHFIGISARPDAMAKWGIPPENQLQLWDWVGGRYSLWGTTGLPLALAIGMDAFRDLLAGAHTLDCHFRDAPWHDNLPVLMALIGHWNTNHLNIGVHAILPYDGRLKQLPAYLMQLEMESNGKCVNRDDKPVQHNTCPVVFGDSGTNAQHSFFQLLHQGTRPVACDFILPASPGPHARGEEGARWREHHQLSLANCLAQSRLLALGDAALDDHQTDTVPAHRRQPDPAGEVATQLAADTVPEHRRYRGNQPSSTLVLDELTPYALGALIALYEHKVFTQSVLWGINPFDQWGVEMGKRIAIELVAPLQGSATTGNLDSSTKGLLVHLTGQGLG